MSLSQLDGPRLSPLGGTARQLIVLVHGYGADGNDLISLGKVWQARFPDAAFFAPNGPEPAPGSPGFQWFALTDLNPEETERGVEAAAPGLDAAIDAELAAHKLNPENLALLGFSQGAMMALHIGLHRKVPPLAILSYSGLLAGRIPMPAPGGAYPPVFLSHGDSDQVVPPQMLFLAAGALRQVGAQIDWHLARNTAHGIDPESLELGAQFLRNIIVPLG
ncbi:MAG: prolyl oligopeptidase family serine peptidase [Alphaproteobacteria bacterium]|nr:prolyl oligopeptidase family serine peptidase [Alphaproteobacteria bacterium]